MVNPGCNLSLNAPATTGAFYFFDLCLITPKFHLVSGTKYAIHILNAMNLQHYIGAWQSLIISNIQSMVKITYKERQQRRRRATEFLACRQPVENFALY